MNVTGNIANYYHSKQVSPDGIFPFINIEKIYDSIVSYLSIVYSQSRHQKNNSVYFSPYESQTLILLVKKTLYQEWKLSSRYMTPLLSVPNFYIKKGVFITFKNNNDLRGCIGTFDSNKNTIINDFAINNTTTLESIIQTNNQWRVRSPDTVVIKIVMNRSKNQKGLTE